MKQLWATALVGVAASCAAIPLNTRGASVRIIHQTPEGCEYVGTVEGDQGNWFTGPATSNRNLEVGARNDLKNNAAAAGANVVVLITDRAGQTGSWGEHGGSVRQTNVVYVGEAYHCPEYRPRTAGGQP